MERPAGQPDPSARQDGDAVASTEASRFHARLVEELPDAVIGTDADYRVTVWNPAAERLYGRSAAEAIGRPARELATYEGDGSRRELEAALDRHGWVRRELRARRPSGQCVDVDVIVTAIRDEAGAVTGHLGIHRDITERKRVEREHRRLSAVVQHSSDFIGVSDLEGRVLFLNEAGRRLVGLGSMEEARARRVSDFFAPDDREQLRDELLPAIIAEGRRGWRLDFVHFRTGRRIPMWWDAFRVDDPETGEPIALATVSRDLTEQRRTEDELRAYRRRIDTIFARMTDAFVAVDGDLRLQYVNDRAGQLLGELVGTVRRGAELVGRTVAETLPGTAGADLERAMRRALSGRQPIAMEYLAAEHDRWFDIHMYPSDEGLGVYFRDVTVSKAAEAARHRRTRQAAAVAALGVRASGGHDTADLMDEAAVAVARALGVELVAISRLRSGPERLVVVAGAGWAPGAVGRAEAPMATRGPSARAVVTGAPVVVQDLGRDLGRDERWEPSELLQAHRVVSAAAVPIPGALAPFGALEVYSRAVRRFDDDELNFLRAVANVLHTAIERARLEQRVAEARDAERRRIARVLHDETLQELGVALARASSGAAGGDRDEALVDTLLRAGEQVRAAIHDLRVSDDQDRTFPELLDELLTAHRSMAPHQRFVLDVDDVPDKLPGDTAHEVVRILGEALTNARRHADASRVHVRVAVDDRELTATVEDDGRGPLDESPEAGGGHGIAGMRERAELLGGELTLAPTPEGGTRVQLRAPLGMADPDAERVRVLIVDDHAAIRESIALAFEQDDAYRIVGLAGSLAEARTMLDGVDVAIIDPGLPDGAGTELIADLREASPQAQALVLSATVDRAATARAVERGAAAVLGKTTHLHQIVTAVRRLRAGEKLIPLTETVELLRFAGRERDRARDEQRLIDSLTPREREVLQLLADGLDNRAVASRLYISPRTQRNHVANILAKLGVHSQLQALVFALRHGIVEVRGASAPGEDGATAPFGATRAG